MIGMIAEETFVEETVSYIEKTYGVLPERPWPKYPDHLTFKAKEPAKWFALILPVKRRVLGVSGEGETVVLNVKSDAGTISMLTALAGYRPGYHMNKQNWLSVFLDGTVPLAQIFDRIDESYQLVTDSPTKRIYEAVKRIPKGHVATYGQVAEMAGDKKMARAVGNALHKNPDPEHIPCFRVVNAKGELAGAFAFGGAGVQEALLRADGIEVTNGKVDLKTFGIPPEYLA